MAFISWRDNETEYIVQGVPDKLEEQAWLVHVQATVWHCKKTACSQPRIILHIRISEQQSVTDLEMAA